MKRAAGIVLPISALPSPYGIGSLGQAAYDFIDFLADSGQTYWQMLPVGPISFGDSPYQALSVFAGNPYYVNLDLLMADGLLAPTEAFFPFWGDDPRRVDYGAVYQSRFAILEKAFERGWERDKESVARFSEKNRHWLPDYALYMALKRHFNMQPWPQWPDEDIRLHKRPAVALWREKLDRDVRFFTYIQYLFAGQWRKLKEYAARKGVQIIGDLPIYVAMDSADMWANPKNYLLDEDNVPTLVAGVPPDAFTADGQLWGNPIYDWKRMAQDGFSWWKARMARTLELFDVVRLDHFRGLESYWAVPYGDPTAATGHWETGPGAAFIRMLHENFSDAFIIAEDLGYITPEVRALLDMSGFPGMKVLQFAFDHREPSDYLPHRYDAHCVCYTGTHDNTTVTGWFAEAEPEDVAVATRYLGLNEAEGLNWGFIRGGMSSVARLFIAQMQDYLALGSEARMNTPGKAEGNWQWRLLPGEASPVLAKKIKDFTVLYGR